MPSLSESGAETTRRGLDAASSLGMKSSEALRQCANLQVENASHLIDGSLRITQAMLGNGHTGEAIEAWSRLCEQTLTRALDTTRNLTEGALRAQSELAEISGRLVSATNRAMTESVSQVSRAVSEAAGQASGAAADASRAAHPAHGQHNVSQPGAAHAQNTKKQ